MKLFNTLTRKKEEFKSIKKSVIDVYTCGPTVYQYAHIGNLRTYIFEDILKRVLLYNDFKVKHVMNITDVGHLTSDQDTGEDKIELGAKRENKSAWEIATFYTKAFKEDIKKLNILPPSIWCKATDHIKEQSELIKILEKKGYTYRTDDGIYFDTSKLKDYGKLAKLDIEGLQEGARVDVKGKKHKTDFALWKFSPKNQQRQMEWKSLWSDRGFPGWHLECSAMAQKYLGNPFDIHCGGIDLIPVHHTNEIAQTEAATGKPLANVWMHGEFLVLKEEKMSKSLGNIITLKTLEDQGYNPLVYRYLCLTAHYRMPLTFSWEALEGAKNALQHLKEKIAELKKDKKTKNAEKYLKQFQEAINDDLNIPIALSILWEALKDDKLSDSDKLSLVKEFDKVFGLDLLKKSKPEKIPSEILKLAKERETTRKNQDWKKADELRNKIKNLGYQVEDLDKGFRVKKL